MKLWDCVECVGGVIVILIILDKLGIIEYLFGFNLNLG